MIDSPTLDRATITKRFDKAFPNQREKPRVLIQNKLNEVTKIVAPERKAKIYDLSRFASSLNVVGGFSKLLTYFKRSVEYTEIFTFADLRWSSRWNNVYLSNGFAEVHVTKPAYMYYDYASKKRIHRMNFTKDKLAAKLSKYNSNLTERENANNHGYLAVYDCGNAKYNLSS